MNLKAVMIVVCVALSATAAFALQEATELFLVSVGRGQGACPGGVCAEWRTSVWITNPSTTDSAQVEIAFLKRGQSNTSPATVNVSVGPNASEQFTDIFNDSFHLDGVFGALRLRSNIPIVAFARTYDSNVHTTKGTGGAGQDLAGIAFESGIPSGKSTFVAGLAQDSSAAWRSNFGVVEEIGQSCTVQAEVLDTTGNVLGTKTYQLLPFEAIQPSITDIGAPLGTNQRVRLSVTAGNGAIIAFGSLVDNVTGDPTTSDQVRGLVLSATELAGTWSGAWNNVTFGSTGTATIVVTPNVPARTAQFNVTLTGSVFGGSPPPPENEAATLTPDGIAVNSESAFAGALTATITPAGIITGQATPPSSSPIAKVTFFGYATAKQMNIAYEVTFTAAQGGGTAGGFCTLTKS
ncbi:MAG TPA: hypothetical protein VMT19_07225 [Thermoanaerobaculaceae bacterium]|nr:hypothetical protein [Thermoanaerobaculaceae bacterium]